MKRQRLRRITALLLAVVLMTTSCRGLNGTVEDLIKEGGDSWREKVTDFVMTEGEKLIATTMSLTKTEGTVNVATKKGKNRSPVEGLKLYDGYGMATQEVSYAWINLDHVKLVKMDETSEIDIQKKKNDLEVTIHSGSIFFNITEPLEEDESMNIRTSSMMVGIRGTCGWVSSGDEKSAQVYILEGQVTASCPDTGQEVSVSAGEMVEVRITETGGSQISVSEFSAADIPAFITEELEADEQLAQAILNASGLDVLNPPQEPAQENNGGLPESVQEQYRAILLQAASYDYGVPASEASGQYQYALVQMQAGDTVPALLLKQTMKNNVEYVRIFQYDPNTGVLYQPVETLSEGVADAGGYRGVLSMAWDGDGILSTSWSSGTGDADVYRATMEGGSLNTVLLWEGRIDTRPEEFSSLSKEIRWYATRVLSVLQNWPDDAGNGLNGNGEAETENGTETQTEAAAETETEIETAAETEAPTEAAALPTDGGRIVFTGTIRLYSYDEVVALQGSPDPNAPWADTSETFRLIVLDAPQAMTLGSSDPSAGMINGTVAMINVSGAGGLAQYDGHHTFSIDPNRTRFPSDTSIPLGQPYTSDVHVLD